MPGVPARASSRPRLGCRWRHPEKVSVKGGGSFMSAGGHSARPAGALSPPLGSLAGKPPDAEMTGPPEGCPVGAHHLGSLFRAFQPLPSAGSLYQMPSTLWQPPGPSQLLPDPKLNPAPHRLSSPPSQHGVKHARTGSDNLGTL